MGELKQNRDSSTTVFDVLRSRRRRDVLRCLREGRTVELADLAAEIAETDGASPGGGSDETAKESADEAAARAEIALYHTHIPKLTDAGVVRYDPERETIALAADDDRLERYWAVLAVESARSHGR